MEQPQSSERRTILKGAAWSLPVVVAAAGTPAYANSVPCDPQDVSGYGATITNALDPIPSPNLQRTANGVWHYLYTQEYVWTRATIVYRGPDTLPAGSLIRIATGLYNRQTVSYTPEIVSGGEFLDTPVNWSAPGISWGRTFLTTAPVPAGTTFTIRWRFWSAPSGTSATNDWDGGGYNAVYFIPNTCGDLSVAPGMSVGTGSSSSVYGTTQPNWWLARVNRL